MNIEGSGETQVCRGSPESSLLADAVPEIYTKGEEVIVVWNRHFISPEIVKGKWLMCFEFFN